MVYILRLLLVLISCWQLTAFADDSPQTLDQLKTALEKIRVDTGLPAFGVALVDKNGPYWVAGLGEADLATHKPANENSLFRIGSSSKMFVALSILKLVEEGKLHLNDKLSDLAPEIYYENKWEKTNPILLVHLLEHTTGWDDMSGSVYGYQDANITLKAGLDMSPKYRHSRWIPGTRYAYNNAGPAVSAYIVQKVSGIGYEDYVQENFFNPLHMTSTTFFESELFRQRGVNLYSTDKKVQPYWHLVMRPSGAINSSPADLANFLHFLILRGNFNQQQVISEASITRMETPTTTLGAQAGALAGYGLHNYVDGFASANIAFRGHDGDVSGGHCKLRYIPELQTGFVLMINQDNLEAFDKANKLIRAFLLKDVRKAPQKQMVLPEKFKKLSGYYIAIDPRSDISRFSSDILGVMRFSVDGEQIHREPLLGGWETPSTDYAVSENLLANAWSGLPTIAIVNDPLAGEAVAVTDGLVGALFQRVSSVRVLGILGWMALTACLSIVSVVFALVWSVQLARGKIIKGAAISIRVWPLATTLILMLALFAPQIFNPSIEQTSQLSLFSIVTFFCSLAYPVLAAYSLFNCISYRRAEVNRVMYWHSFVLGILHSGFAICLAYYGFIGIRLWV